MSEAKKVIEKVSEEVAKQEVEKWLEFKKLDQEDVDEIDDRKASLSRAIQKGYLSLDKECNFIQTLKFPIKSDSGEMMLDKLTYKPRLTMSDVEKRTKGLDMKNTFVVIRAYVSALTDVNSGLISKMDSSDNKIAQAIAIFFL